ncbi:MAG: stage IV sporulation protein A [Clostridia bacterium]|nr:stage IV sporulation protein A [Clostridia bacterium]
MERAELYRDIAKRTQGDIYIGVVGPVRTGKSTFIKRFMDTLVIPQIDNEYVKERVIDELPQSGSGKTIMTTQPKFVPNDAVSIKIGDDDSTLLSVRMIDCVGYMVEGALGGSEEEIPRMVRTPWYDHDIPFDEAAEIGTRKVITEHSTVGIVVLTDGSITGIPRSAYSEAEEKVFAELKGTGKPFAVILNSTRPESDEAIKYAEEISALYGVNALPLNVMEMDAGGINSLLENLLLDFPIREVSFELPGWITSLGAEHPIVGAVLKQAKSAMSGVTRMRDHSLIRDAIMETDDFNEPELKRLALDEGCAYYRLEPKKDVFYRIMSEECGYEIGDETELMSTLKEFAVAKREYDRVAGALYEASETGYGLVPPMVDEMQLERPEIIRQGNRFGVRLKAHASGLHIIRVDIESEVNPLVGTAEQGEELAGSLMKTFETRPEDIWSTNIFGKPIYDLVKDGMTGKINNLPPDVRMRLRTTLNKMVNEGCNGLICIML